MYFYPSYLHPRVCSHTTLMETENWELFRTFKDQTSAELMARRLESEGVTSSVRSSLLEAAVETAWQVWVSKDLAHRARWILANSDFSDSELAFLATGELGPKASTSETKWKCADCEEEIEQQFDTCWKCGGSKP